MTTSGAAPRPTPSSEWLVTYDIVDDRRRNAVFKLLKKHGIPLQYSVFLVQAESQAVGVLMASLARLIEKKTDDVRAYHLPAAPRYIQLGHSMLPEGVLFAAGLP